MKKKIIGIFVCMMLIAAPVLSAAEIMNDKMRLNIDEGYITTGWIEQAKLLASDGAPSDRFGECVSIDGDYAIIGAWLDDDNGGSSGSAYIFKRNGTDWDEEAKLIASDGAPGDHFGECVSIDGDYAIIGAQGADSAYIFKCDGTAWSEEAKLTGSDGQCFGLSVSIDGDYAIIGAHGDDDFTGAAYIFKRNGTNWTQQAKLIASDGEKIDCFGRSVSIDGDYAIIGAYVAGSAYIFERNGTNWTQQAKMTGTENSFAFSVSIYGDYAIIGDHYGNGEKGVAYVFKRNSTAWSEETKLTASDGAEFDDFGCSVSIDGEYAIVGAESNDDNGSHSGSAYIFKRNDTAWIEEAKLIASDGASCDFFGNSVSIDGDYAVAGASFDDDNGDESGSAYVLKKNQPPNAPTITGATSGKVGVEYEYNFSLSDPDDDSMYLRVDWSNGTPGPWHGPFDSDTTVTLNHTWNQKGTYTIRAQAKDIYGVESDWGSLNITMDGPPTVEIIKPKNGLYFFNFKLRSYFFRKPLIIGSIAIEIDASDEDSGIDRVEFYIDGKFIAADTSEPYSLTWGSFAFFEHTIKTVAVDNYGNWASEEIKVWKFF